MEVYNITTYCICGGANSYKLAFPRWPIVSVGALQTDTVQPGDKKVAGIKVADINLCRDTHKYLSRQMLYFAYDPQKHDWVAGAGRVPDEYTRLYGFEPQGKDEHREENRKQIFCLSRKKFNTLLEKQVPRLLKGERLSCQRVEIELYFEVLGKEPVALGDLAGIGIFPTNFNRLGSKLYYNGDKHEWIECPFLGQLPFGWYIDIVNHSGIVSKMLIDMARTIIVKQGN